MYQSSSTADAPCARRNVCTWWYAASRKQVTGSGSRNSAPPAAMDTSRRWVVVGSFGVPGAERTEARAPDLVLNTFVDPCSVTKHVYFFSILVLGRIKHQTYLREKYQSCIVFNIYGEGYAIPTDESPTIRHHVNYAYAFLLHPWG